MKVDVEGLSGAELYRLLIGMVVPRPIAWVGTRSAAGIDNIAPFSFFMGVSSAPPTLAISIAGKGKGVRKDTLNNILETNVFTVSIPSVRHLAQVAATAVALPPEESEFVAADLTALQGAWVDAPIPAGVLATAECRLFQHLDIGTTTLVIGEILGFHLHDDVVLMNDSKVTVDVRALDPLARLGGIAYTGLGETIEQATEPLSRSRD